VTRKPSKEEARATSDGEDERKQPAYTAVDDEPKLPLTETV
jgi:hypothetical protein